MLHTFVLSFRVTVVISVKMSKCQNVKMVQLEPEVEQWKACVPFIQSFTGDRNFCRSSQMSPLKFSSQMFQIFLSNVPFQTADLPLLHLQMM